MRTQIKLRVVDENNATCSLFTFSVYEGDVDKCVSELLAVALNKYAAILVCEMVSNDITINGVQLQKGKKQ